MSARTVGYSETRKGGSPRPRHARTARWATLALLAALIATVGVSMLGASAAARGGCSPVEKAKSQKNVNPKGREPLAVGDSVMLLAIPDLAEVGYDVDAQGCRSLDKAIVVLRKLRATNKLPHLVVLAVGTDGRILESRIRAALRVIGPDRVLGLVTPRELGGAAGFDAAVVRQTAREEPQRIILLDWVKYSNGHRGWFQPDRTHLTFRGAAAFARLFSKATRYANPDRTPNGVSFP